jgi:hypothetical protein
MEVVYGPIVVPMVEVVYGPRIEEKVGTGPL